MKAVLIGKGMCRIIVRSKAQRKRLARIPGVIINGNRVIFPEQLTHDIELILEAPSKKKQPKPDQFKLF